MRIKMGLDHFEVVFVSLLVHFVISTKPKHFFKNVAAIFKLSRETMKANFGLTSKVFGRIVCMHLRC